MTLPIRHRAAQTRTRIGIFPYAVIAALLAGPPLRANELAEARTAIESGDFARADALLAPLIDDPAAPVVSAPAILREQMRRIRHDFRLDEAAMLAKLRRSMPDATADDLARWRASGDLQHRVIDGEVRYFAREPGNLFRASAEARERRTLTIKPAGASFDLPRHVEHLIAQAERSRGAEVYPVKHRVTYRLSVKEGHPRIQPGATVRCWLPFPREYRQQRDVELVTCDPPDGIVADNTAPHRTIFFERTIKRANEPVSFTATYTFVTSAYCPQPNPAFTKPYNVAGELYQAHTAERPPHIVFTPQVRAIVDEVTAGETNPLLKARKLFAWVSDNMPWCAEMEYGTIFNLSDKGISARRGDCGVQGMSFITLCRAAGIPARWQSGWETLPADWNMHDWTEFYVEPYGWLPADPSYGLQPHPDPRVRYFFCGNLDPYRMIVNADYAQPLEPAKISFRSEPNDFQRGEIEIDGHNLYFDEWSWSFQHETQPLDRSVVAAGEMITERIADWLRAERIPGAVIAIGRKNKSGFETWRKAFGYMQLEPKRVPMTVDAVFDMASLTKPIATGTSLMKLVERGDVRLDDPVSKYLPEFAAGDKAAVTVRHLMTHCSGMKPYLGAADQARIRKQAGYPCRDATHTAIRTAALTAAPGEKVIYSCLNAILCAEIVEQVSKQPLDVFAHEQIFAPLGMGSTGFNPDDEFASRLVPTTPGGVLRGGDALLRGAVHDPLAAMQDGVSGNAGLFSSAGDLERFAQMLLNGGTLAGQRILRAETIARMTGIANSGAIGKNGKPDARGLLWDIYPPRPQGKGLNTRGAYGHTGYTGTALRIYPEEGIYVIALTNRVHPDDTAKVKAFRNAVWETVGTALLGDSTRISVHRPIQGQRAAGLKPARPNPSKRPSATRKSSMKTWTPKKPGLPADRRATPVWFAMPHCDLRSAIATLRN
jgi:CubicO group peptidase (beta-lactamase class C family)/transglutaminase-like putative cysteine protease